MLRLFKASCATLALFSAFAAWAAGDVGIVDRLSGEVAVKSPGGNAFRATPFMKVREGDLLTLTSGSLLQIVYFDARRRELWQDAGSFKAAMTGSTALVGKPATVSEAKGVPSRESLNQVVNVQRMGSLTLRGVNLGPDEETLARAHADYLKWTATAAPDDILPELSMIGLLGKHAEPAQLAPYLQALARKQQDRPDVKALIEQYTAQAQAPAAKP